MGSLLPCVRIFRDPCNSFLALRRERRRVQTFFPPSYPYLKKATSEALDARSGAIQSTGSLPSRASGPSMLGLSGDRPCSAPVLPLFCPFHVVRRAISINTSTYGDFVEAGGPRHDEEPWESASVRISIHSHRPLVRR